MSVIVLALVSVPLVLALLAFIVRNDFLRNLIMRLGAFFAIGGSIAAAYLFFTESDLLDETVVKLAGMDFEHFVNYFIIAVEVILAIYIIVTGIRHKKYVAPVFAAIQTPLLIWFELTHSFEIEANTVIDRFTVIMLLIIGVIGGLIALYTVGYMKWYHENHPEVKERKSFFFAVILMFLGAMFGLVCCNNMIWLYFCWEITSFSSFLLIGYTKSETAINNSFKALTINLGGGVAFAFAIVISGIKLGTIELFGLILQSPTTIVLAVVMLLSLAALTKSAQFPFQGWLLGAMVAPTPSSALLHSATMVKAGVYLLIRLAPLLGVTTVGRAVTFIGGITFLGASIMAITQEDAKKILAYSTIANLGLIITCASIGTAESLWAAIFLVIFHAVSKSLLFLTVGEIEHQLHTRKIDYMSRLFGVSKELVIYMLIGIAGMFLAPFGMLISKWAAMKAFIDSNNLHIIVILVFGSAATLFYWAKWMGKLVSISNNPPEKSLFHNDERISIFFHAILTLSACFFFPFISEYVVIDYINSDYVLHTLDAASPITMGNISLMLVMLSLLIILPVSFITFSHRKKGREVLTYMAGENIGDDDHFNGSLGVQPKVELKNWYMKDIFTKEIEVGGNCLCLAAMLVTVFVIFTQLLKI